MGVEGTPRVTWQRGKKKNKCPINQPVKFFPQELQQHRGKRHQAGMSDLSVPNDALLGKGEHARPLETPRCALLKQIAKKMHEASES